LPDLTEVRWHGRGGQGVVTVSALLAQAALLDGKHVQSFPEFGPERAGAPVKGFTRISDHPIEIHCQVYHPDVVVVLDPTLLKTVDVTEGMRGGDVLLLNYDRSPEAAKKEMGESEAKVYTVNAKRIALDVLGRPIFNTAMLGALIGVREEASMPSVVKAIEERFPGALAEKNVEVVKRAAREVVGAE